MSNFIKKGPPPQNLPKAELEVATTKYLEKKKISKSQGKGKQVFFGILVILILGGAVSFGFYEYDLWKKKGKVIQEAQEKIKTQIYENQDEDGDGLTTIQEMEAGTKVKEKDTDLDGIPDGWEVNHKLNPLDYTDALADDDEDRLTNLEEYRYETDPANPDTDGDGFKDGEEVRNGFNPKGSGKLKIEEIIK
jgi:hypothetical protein